MGRGRSRGPLDTVDNYTSSDRHYFFTLFFLLGINYCFSKIFIFNLIQSGSLSHYLKFSIFPSLIGKKNSIYIRVHFEHGNGVTTTTILHRHFSISPMDIPPETDRYIKEMIEHSFDLPVSASTLSLKLLASKDARLRLRDKKNLLEKRLMENATHLDQYKV